jgi:(4S)-4-hydroxy-5-phosphonooxypentane-2,3-dione isomerase
MYVITVEFEVKTEHIDAFRDAINENASLSLANEPECHQFDVCVDIASPSKVFLYEIYTDRAAFDHHLATDHFKQFNAQVTPWVVAKQVRAYERSFPKP